jgi:predicted phage-related endonuclease
MTLTLVPTGPVVRPFTIVDAPQRSAAWFQARLGRLTGSRAADMLSTTKKREEGAARRDLRTQLVLERLTGQPQEEAYVSPEMRRAVLLEPLAFAAYEALTGRVARPSGFLSHDTLAVGCSLDGHFGDFTGILEVKCPKSATHLRYLQAGTIPEEYLPQIVHALWVTGAAWCDFCSFDDRFPPHLQTQLVRYERNEQEIALYTLAVARFLSEVGDELAAVQALHPEAA